MEINNKLYKDIVKYCEDNGISDVDKFINNCLRDGFTAKKYGSAPNFVNQPIKKDEPIKEEVKPVEEPAPVVEEIKKENKKNDNIDNYSIYDIK